jgi:hypothetical protein
MPTEASIHACQKISSFRRSKMSAVAPASSPRSSTGRLAAVCINAISSGDAVSEVISHVPAVSCIHVPTDETVLAIQRSRKRGIFSGAKPLGLGATATTGPVFGVSRGISKSSLRCRKESEDCWCCVICLSSFRQCGIVSLLVAHGTYRLC